MSPVSSGTGWCAYSDERRYGKRNQGIKEKMSDQFFEQPILNSPYACPARHWELYTAGQRTKKVIENRRRADFVTPIPKPRKAKGSQTILLFDEGKGLSTSKQAYRP
jgi:type III restriction enzyme